jgi:hypothetical protein
MNLFTTTANFFLITIMGNEQTQPRHIPLLNHSTVCSLELAASLYPQLPTELIKAILEYRHVIPLTSPVLRLLGIVHSRTGWELQSGQ